MDRRRRNRNRDRPAVTRRAFVRGVLSTGAALSLPSWARAEPPFHPGPLLADLHVHPLLDNWVEHSFVGKSNPQATAALKKFMNKTEVSWSRAWRTGVDVMCVAHFDMFNEFLSMPTDPNRDAPRHALRLLDQLEALLEGKVAGHAREALPYATLVRTAKELKALTERPKVGADGRRHRDSRIAVVHTLEGGHHAGTDPGAVKLFAERGVALITVTHFFAKGAGSSGNPLPFFPDAFAPREPMGLTGLGTDIVKACEEAGVIVDISHATATTVGGILDVAERPMLASHSSVRALGEHPYSLYDEHIQEIARRGGIIGIILMPHWLGNYTTAEMSHLHGGLDDAVRTVLHIIKLTGSHEHVAIGSDFKGYIPGPYDMERLSDVYRLRNRLRSVLSESQVDDVMANNAIRFLSENWGLTS